MVIKERAAYGGWLHCSLFVNYFVGLSETGTWGIKLNQSKVVNNLNHPGGSGEAGTIRKDEK